MEDITMEATPEFTYQIDHNPQFQKIDTLELSTTFVGPVGMEPIQPQSNISCWLSTRVFIEEDGCPKKKELLCFLRESGVDEDEAAMLILKLIELVSELTSSVLYRSDKYALTMWMTFYVFLSSQEPILNDFQNEEAIRASLEYYENNIGFKPASKLGLNSLSKRIYNYSYMTEQKNKRRRISIIDHCTICLEGFIGGQEVSSLPCGHDFDNICIVKWLEINHVCPLCRFALPCEDEFL